MRLVNILLKANTRNEVHQEPSLSGPQLIKFVDEILNEERFKDCSEDFKNDLRYWFIKYCILPMMWVSYVILGRWDIL